MDNIKPEIEVKARRVGGATYQVPVEVRLNRKLSLGIRWLIRYSRARAEKTMIERLAGEILMMHTTIRAARSRREKTPTRWLKPTRLSPITDGKRRL